MGTVVNPYLYAGYRYDKETGLYYLQSRYYKPDTGRFLTRDTFEGMEKQPLSLNSYTYVQNNPVMNIDPTGHVSWRFYYYSYKGLKEIISGLKDIFIGLWKFRRGMAIAFRWLIASTEVAAATAQYYAAITFAGLALSIGYSAYRIYKVYKGIKEVYSGIKLIRKGFRYW